MSFHTTVIPDEEFFQRQRQFQDFLDSPEMYGTDLNYKDRLRQLIKRKDTRFIVNVNHVRQLFPDIAKGLLQEPLGWIPPVEAALREALINIDDLQELQDLENNPISVGFEGSFGAFHTTPRQLSARFLGNMVCLDGIVTSCSLVRPKLLRSVHYVESRKAFVMREYYDATMLSGHAPTPINYPTTTGAGEERLVSEFGLSRYRDYQTITIQELPEKAPAGQLPRAVDVVLDGDLVDKAKPGDRIQVIGVYKSLAALYGGAVPATFRAVLIAQNVRALGRGNAAPALTPIDRQNIKDLSKRRDIFELLSRSLAPSIYGQDYIKKAVLLQLLGGVEKNLANGTHIRGDINLMLVGDPSTAKSQMLRFVLGLAPLAIATTGRGSSGVGLTAAVTSDRETGERRLEAGAMVLADRGIVCIDEFDKMSDVDRVAIHEVMEQQTVTIAKAGIHASLNARCSVLAAANPVWGQYRETANPQENIRLPDSLLSRFDLLFIVLDTSEPAHDRRLSEHVLRLHRHVPVGLAEGAPIVESAIGIDDDAEADLDGDEAPGQDEASTVFQKHYARPPSDEDEEEDAEDEDDEILTLPFVRKYLAYARSSVQPVLTKAASEYISAAYAEFRQKRNDMSAGGTRTTEDGRVEATTFPVTPRTLETLIRLASAHAKARLSNRVEKKDAKIAQELIQVCLLKEVKRKPRKRQAKKAKHDGESDASSSEEESEADEAPLADNEKRTIASADHLEERKKLKEEEDQLLGKEKMAIEMQDLNLIADPTQATLEGTQAGSSYIRVTPDESSQVAMDDSLPFLSQSQTQTTIAQSEAEPSQPAALAKPSPTQEAAIKLALHRLRVRLFGASFGLADLRTDLQSDPACADLTDGQIETVLQEMEGLNMLMYRQGIIYLI